MLFCDLCVLHLSCGSVCIHLCVCGPRYVCTHTALSIYVLGLSDCWERCTSCISVCTHCVSVHVRAHVSYMCNVWQGMPGSSCGAFHLGPPDSGTGSNPHPPLPSELPQCWRRQLCSQWLLSRLGSLEAGKLWLQDDTLCLTRVLFPNLHHLLGSGRQAVPTGACDKPWLGGFGLAHFPTYLSHAVDCACLQLLSCMPTSEVR